MTAKTQPLVCRRRVPLSPVSFPSKACSPLCKCLPIQLCSRSIQNVFIIAADLNRRCIKWYQSHQSSEMTVENRLQELKRFEEQSKSEFEAIRKTMVDLRQAIEDINRQDRERDKVLMQIQQVLGRLVREKELPGDAPAAFPVQPKVEGAVRASTSATNLNPIGSLATANPDPDCSVFLNPVMAKATLTSQTRNGKVEFPVFDGSTGVRRWIFQAEPFFVPNQSPPEVMSQIASLNMGGEALQWFEFYIRGRDEWPGWKEFYSDLCLRFELV